MKADVQIVSHGDRDTPANAVVSDTPAQHQFDISTSSYLFDLAIEKNEETDFRHGVLERHAHFHIKGIHPHPTFSFRFGTINTEEGPGEQPARLWAQRHLLAREPYYVISASPLDMDVSKKNRSEFFLGKLKESHGARCFTGEVTHAVHTPHHTIYLSLTCDRSLKLPT